MKNTNIAHALIGLKYKRPAKVRYLNAISTPRKLGEHGEHERPVGKPRALRASWFPNANLSESERVLYLY